MLKDNLGKSSKGKEKKTNSVRRWLIAVALLVVLVGIILIVFLNKKDSVTYDIDNIQELWLIYDMNLEKIENNYQEISTPNTDIVCNTLKDISIDDEYYIDTLNNLLCFIQSYYYDLIEYDEAYYNYIDEYRNATQISDLDLKDLNFHLMDQKELYNNRLDRFHNIAISESEEKNKVILNIVDNFLKFDEEFYDFSADFYDMEIHTYQELLVHKLVEMEYVTNLSEWLKTEYYSLIN